MNKALVLLTYIFAVIGIVSSVMFLLSDIDTMKYIQISIVGFFVSDAIREFTSKTKKKNILIYKSAIAIVVSVLIGFIF